MQCNISPGLSDPVACGSSLREKTLEFALVATRMVARGGAIVQAEELK